MTNQIGNIKAFPVLNRSIQNGDDYLQKGNYQAALTNYQKSLFIDEGFPDSINLQVYLRNQIAFCQLQMNDYSAAAKEIKQANKLIHTSRPTLPIPLISNHHLIKGKFLIATDSASKAIPLLLQADSLNQKINHFSNFKALVLYTELGNAYRIVSPGSERSEYFIDQALKLIEEDPNLLNLGMYTYNVKANCLRLRRKYLEGLSYCNLALDLASKAPYLDSIFMSQSYNTKGHMLKKLERYTDAFEAIQKAINLGEQLNNEVNLMKFYEGMLMLNLSRRDSTQFHYQLEKYKTRFNSFPDAFRDPRSIEAYYQYKMGNWDKALLLYEELIADYKNLQKANQGFFEEAYMVLSEIYAQSGQSDLAISAADQLITLVFGPTFALGNIQQDPTVLKELNKNQIRILTLFYSLYPKAYFGNIDEFKIDLPTLKQGIDQLIQLDSIFIENSSLLANSTQLTYAKEHFHTTYAKAVEVCYTLFRKTRNTDFIQQANFFIERVKYNLFFKNLLDKQKVNDKGSVLSAKLLDVNQKLEELQQKLYNQTGNQININEKVVALQRTKSQLEQQLSQSEHALVAPFSTKNYTFANLSLLRDLAQKNDQVFLQYHIGPTKIHLILIAPESTKFIQVLKPTHFDSLINQFKFLLSSPENMFQFEAYHVFVDAAYELYQILIEPIEQELTNSKIIVSPDANYPMIPLGALISAKPDSINKTIDYQSLPYLAKQSNFSYTFSLKNHLWNRLQKNKNTYLEQPRILAYAYAPKNNQLAELIGSLRKDPLSEIQHTAKELQFLQAAFGLHKNSFQFGKNSTKDHFLTHCEKDYNIIHLALHAKADTTNRFEHKIFFRNALDTNHVNYLTGPEISRKHIKAQLVVLSSCETTVGQIIPGEGTFNFARDFQMAGAQQVVSTLWPVDDNRTLTLMKYFYNFLSKQDNPANALTKAQRMYLETSDEYLSFPGFWAGFTLIH